MAYQSATQYGHLHGEAFMLMWYECSCGHRERIWNSRDGVTPFGCGCPSCGGTMKHRYFGADEYAPKYNLLTGQRFWRDGTPDEAEAIMRRRIEKLRDNYPLNPGDEERLISEARSGEGNEFKAGWPMLDLRSNAI